MINIERMYFTQTSRIVSDHQLDVVLLDPERACISLRGPITHTQLIVSNLLAFWSVLRYGFQDAGLVTRVLVLRAPSHVHKTSLVFVEQRGILSAKVLMFKGRLLSLPHIKIRSAVLPHVLGSQTRIVVADTLSVSISRGKLYSGFYRKLINFHIGE